MTRALYRWLLWLHPPLFRRQFAGEMLWIFDQSADSQGVCALFFDGLISLARQWLLRSGSWKVAAGIAGGLVQVTAGGLGMLLFGHAQAAHIAGVELRGAHIAVLSNPGMPIAMDSLVRLTVWTAGGLMLVVTVVTIWVRNITGRRMRGISRKGAACSNCAR